MELQFFKIISLLLISPLNRMYHDMIYRIIKTNRKRSLCSIILYIFFISLFIQLIHIDREIIAVVLKKPINLTPEIDLYFIIFGIQWSVIAGCIGFIIKHIIKIIFPVLYLPKKEMQTMLLNLLIYIFIIIIWAIFLRDAIQAFSKLNL